MNINHISAQHSESSPTPNSPLIMHMRTVGIVTASLLITIMLVVFATSQEPRHAFEKRTMTSNYTPSMDTLTLQAHLTQLTVVVADTLQSGEHLTVEAAIQKIAQGASGSFRSAIGLVELHWNPSLRDWKQYSGVGASSSPLRYVLAARLIGEHDLWIAVDLAGGTDILTADKVNRSIPWLPSAWVQTADGISRKEPKAAIDTAFEIATTSR